MTVAEWSHMNMKYTSVYLWHLLSSRITWQSHLQLFQPSSNEESQICLEQCDSLNDQNEKIIKLDETHLTTASLRAQFWLVAEDYLFYTYDGWLGILYKYSNQLFKDQYIYFLKLSSDIVPLEGFKGKDLTLYFI